jgi:hypothetical protein
MLIIDPPAIAGGTDRFQVRVLTFEAKPLGVMVWNGAPKENIKMVSYPV